MAELDIAIVSGCTQLRYASYVGHQLYARRHGTGYHLELAPFEGVDGYWHKVAAVAAHLDEHDWVVWLDDDAFITDLNSTFIRDTIAAAEENEAWLVIAPSVEDELNGAWAAYNSGVFALRNTADARTLLESLRDAPMAAIETWWDESRLGVFTHGDQDALVWFMEERGQPGAIHWADPMRWNARPWHYLGRIDALPVCHFPGHPDKTLAIADFARRMGTDETLVRPAGSGRRDRGLHAKVPSTSRAGARLRQVSLSMRKLRRRVSRKVRWVRETRSWS